MSHTDTSQFGVLTEILLRWEESRQRGDSVTPQELCRDHPHLVDEVSRRIREMELAYGVREQIDVTAPSVQSVVKTPEIAGYEIADALGRGGMGIVYKARHIQLNRPVALKMILAGAHAPPSVRLRFQIEAEAIASLQHPNIVQVHDVGQTDSCPYLALEFIDGGTLAKRLEAGPMPPLEAAELLAKLADAVDFAHRRGVVHRDLKPANVLLQTHIGDPHSAPIPKITDFGLARRIEDGPGHTRSGDILGTPQLHGPRTSARCFEQRRPRGGRVVSRRYPLCLLDGPSAV